MQMLNRVSSKGGAFSRSFGSTWKMNTNVGIVRSPSEIEVGKSPKVASSGRHAIELGGVSNRMNVSWPSVR